MNFNIEKKHIYGYLFRLGQMAVQFAQIKILIQYLGEENYGNYIIFLAIQPWCIMADLGVGQYLRNQITDKLARNEDSRIIEVYGIKYAIRAFFIIITAWFIIAPFLGYFLFKDNSGVIICSFVLAGFFGFLGALGGIGIQARFAKRHFVEGYLISLLPQIVGLLVLFGINYELNNLVGGEKILLATLCCLGLSSICLSLYSFSVFFSQMGSSPELEDIYSWREIWNKSKGFFLFSILSAMTLNVDILILSALLPTNELIQYQIFSRLLTAMFALISVMAQQWRTEVTGLIANKYFKLVRQRRNIFVKRSILFILIFGAGLMATAREIMHFLANRSDVSYIMIMLMIIYWIVRSITDIDTLIVIIRGKMRDLITIAPIQAVITIVLC